MRIAFYAPLKAPTHAVPSGDRRMARQLLAALGTAGHAATLASDLRAYIGDPQDMAAFKRLRAGAAAEAGRIAEDWRRDGPPDLWFCYHPYYKAPDLIGPDLCARFGVPYVTAESSYSERRNIGVWTGMQASVREGLSLASVNICLTARDEAGLAAAAPGARTARLVPFIEMPAPREASPVSGHLVTVAMMRTGDKLASYAGLAEVLDRLRDLDWHLSVAGDGPAEGAVRALLAPFGNRIRWCGRLDAGGVEALLATGSVFVWPGCGEAYGLGYLEAQAAGVPVAALRVAGVPEVVADDVGGLLAEDAAGLAHAVRRLLDDPALRSRLGRDAADRVRRLHSEPAAAARLGAILAAATA